MSHDPRGPWCSRVAHRLRSLWVVHAGEDRDQSLRKEVVDLEFTTGERFARVRQYHSDQTAKTFLYRIEDITGRIEIEE